MHLLNLDYEPRVISIDYYNNVMFLIDTNGIILSVYIDLYNYIYLWSMSEKRCKEYIKNNYLDIKPLFWYYLVSRKPRKRKILKQIFSGPIPYYEINENIEENGIKNFDNNDDYSNDVDMDKFLYIF